MNTLHTIGIWERLFQFLLFFLRDRCFRVRVGGTFSGFLPQEEGVSRREVSSVSLFSVGINSITLVLPPGVLLTLYVDYFSISLGWASMATVERRLLL